MSAEVELHAAMISTAIRLFVVFGVLYAVVDATGRHRNQNRRGPRYTEPKYNNQAQPYRVYTDPATGHGYMVFTSNSSSFGFEEARKQLAWKKWRGLSGHLATIGTVQEAAFLQRTFAGHSNLWIGASDAEEEGVWRWIDGPEEGQVICTATPANNGHRVAAVAGAYCNWATNEPNNYLDRDEDYCLWNYRGEGGWNDDRAADTDANGVLIEFSPPLIETQKTDATETNDPADSASGTVAEKVEDSSDSPVDDAASTSEQPWESSSVEETESGNEETTSTAIDGEWEADSATDGNLSSAPESPEARSLEESKLDEDQPAAEPEID